jgi:hypothetical protein
MKHEEVLNIVQFKKAYTNTEESEEVILSKYYKYLEDAKLTLGVNVEKLYKNAPKELEDFYKHEQVKSFTKEIENDLPNSKEVLTMVCEINKFISNLLHKYVNDILKEDVDKELLLRKLDVCKDIKLTMHKDNTYFTFVIICDKLISGDIQDFLNSFEDTETSLYLNRWDNKHEVIAEVQYG